MSFISFLLRETFNTGVEKLEKLELVKFEEIKKNNVKVFHFKMQVDIQLSCASVLAYFNERLAMLLKNEGLQFRVFRWRDPSILRPNSSLQQVKLQRRLTTFLEETFSEDRPAYSGWKVRLESVH